jgi:hypothetical protein
MNTTPLPDSPEADRELDSLIEGDLSPEAARALQARMRTEPALLARYLEKVRVDSLLRDRDWKSDAATDSGRVIQWHDFRPRTLAWAAAAVLLLSLSLWIWWGPRSRKAEPLVAHASSIKFTPSAVFETTSKVSDDGGLRVGDGVAMADGTVSLRLPSGVEAVIKSPAQFSIAGANRLSLKRGLGWFHVPPEARGFTVETPQMEVVDLGTVFTVMAAEDEQRVQVEQGHVEVRMKAGGIPVQSLVAGQRLLSQGGREVHVTTGHQPLDLSPPAIEPEIVFHESLGHVPDEPFTQRQPLVGSWTVQAGQPRVQNGRFSAESNPAEVMGRFTRAIEPTEDAVLLLSFKSVSPKSFFHSKGFAGVSLFDGNGELFFLGDKTGDSYSWEFLDYGKNYHGKAKDRRGAYDLAIQGSEETFTVRYRQQDGTFEVFRGWGVQGVPLVRGQTHAHLRFDGVRIANGKGGDFSFADLEVAVVRQPSK